MGNSRGRFKAKDEQEMRDRQRLESITPANARLKELASKTPPPREWFEGEEEQLFGAG